MIPAPFEYVRPSTVEDALGALSDEDAKILAGGQSLLPLLRLRLAYPSMLVDIGHLDELRGVRDEGDELWIGGMTSLHTLVHDPLVREHAPLVNLAAATVADPAVRHRGTIGGSLSHADPAGDLPAVAVALDATVEIRGESGSRTVPAREFFVDYLETVLSRSEILYGVRVPKMPGWSFRYEKFNRTAQAWAIVGVAAAVRRSNGTITEARIGLTNMGSVPVRAEAVEAAVAGAPATEAGLREAAGHAAEGTAPPSDLHGQADYRRHLAKVLTRRALTVA